MRRSELKQEALEPILWRNRFVEAMNLSQRPKNKDGIQRQGVEETICLGWRRKRERRVVRSLEGLGIY